MKRFNFDNHAQKIEQATDDFNKKSDAKTEELQNSSHTQLILNTGSSGTKVLAKTEAYNKWLTEFQKRNPFIGKSYMEYAPEYEHDDEEVEAAKVLTDEEAARMMRKDRDGSLHISDDYDPNEINKEREVDNDELDSGTKKFMDMCVIEKLVSERLGWDFDDVMNDVSKELRELHSDELDFELPDDLDDMVQIAVQAAESKAQLLTYNKKDE